MLLPITTKGSWTRSITLALLLAVTAMIASTLLMLFAQGRAYLDRELRYRLLAVSAVAASQFDGKTVQDIRGREDMPKPAFAETVRKLKQVLRSAPGISSVYIMRKTEDPDVFVFVADATSLDTLVELDKNGNAMIEPWETTVQPGDPYDVSHLRELREEAYLRPAVDAELNTDQWGTVLSGYAPILRSDTGEAVAVLGVDMTARDYLAPLRGLYSSFLSFLLLIALVSMGMGAALLYLGRRMEKYQRLQRERMGLLLLATHQMGGPLTICKYSTEMLKDDLDSPQLKQITEEHIRAVEESVDRMNGILDVLKQAAKIEEKGVTYRPSWVYFDALTRNVRDACAPLWQSRRQNIELSFEGDMRAWADPKYIGNALRELLDNALGYSPEGAVVRVAAKRIGDRMRVRVEDAGCGIPAGDLPRMFEKFVRGSNARSHRPDGNGLGLYIVRGIIRSAGGRIHAESRLGKGTVMTFDIPVAPPPDGSGEREIVVM